MEGLPFIFGQQSVGASSKNNIGQNMDKGQWNIHYQIFLHYSKTPRQSQESNPGILD